MRRKNLGSVLSISGAKGKKKLVIMLSQLPAVVVDIDLMGHSYTK